MKEQQLTKAETLSAIKKMDLADYRLRAMQIHNRISNSPLTLEDKKELSKWLSLDFQKVWSDRLPHSTTQDYVSIMEKLNSKSYFSKEVHRYLDPVMEGLMPRFPQPRMAPACRAKRRLHDVCPDECHVCDG